MSQTSLGTFSGGGTISGECNFVDLGGNLDTLASSPSPNLAVYAVAATSPVSGLATIAIGQVGSTDRYAFSFTAPAAAGSYVLVATAGSVTNGVSIAGLVIASFIVGTVPATVGLGQCADVAALSLIVTNNFALLTTNNNRCVVVVPSAFFIPAADSAVYEADIYVRAADGAPRPQTTPMAATRSPAARW